MRRLRVGGGNGRGWTRCAMAVFALLLLASCGGKGDETGSKATHTVGNKMTAQKPGGPGGPGGPGSGETQPPAGAIPMDSDTYMVPIGRDPGGCEQFTMWSATKPVIQMIYYRDRKGGFTADRDDADCGKS